MKRHVRVLRFHIVNNNNNSLLYIVPRIAWNNFYLVTPVEFINANAIILTLRNMKYDY